MIIGREREVEILQKKFTSGKSEFIAIYGRRRVGKTYLIRTFFESKFTLQLTGLANANLQEQLVNFQITIQEQHPFIAGQNVTSWMEAFLQIKQCIEHSKQKKKIIFIDELPWFDTPKSNFIAALEHFWNSWASARKDILLIVCGSAASWMINKLINNKKGLHNRVTQRIKIDPFTLNECQQFVQKRKINLSQYQLIQLYMVLGGIPFYWEAIEKGKSAAQMINDLCFSKNGLLQNEFEKLYQSLFTKAERHELIIEALAKKGRGLTREELIEATKMNNGGTFTTLLNELEVSGFIRKYVPFGKKSRNSLYQLTDFFSLFYLKFMKNTQPSNEQQWLKIIDNPKYRAWSGYAFEQVCLSHVYQIKKALGINGIESHNYAWKSKESDQGAQIDLIIDRRDDVVTVCEMKFSIHPFTIDKKYDAELRNKIGTFRYETKTRKAVYLTLITTFGLTENMYSGNIQNSLNMAVLFE